MVVKEGYKQTEVGVIPEDWEKAVLLDVVEVISGGTPKTSDSSYWGGSIPWLTVADFNTGFRWVHSAEKKITEKGLYESPTTMLLQGDVIISARGTVGIVAQIARPMAFNQSCYGLRARPEIAYTDYVYYSLIQSIYNFQKLAYGGVFSTITRESFKNISINLPPQPEQKAIATALSDIDGLINFLSRLIEKKKNIKQGAMQELLTGKKRLEGFSGEWKFQTMGNLFKFSGGYSASREQLSKVGYSYLHYGDIHGTVKTFVDIKDEYLEIPKLNIGLNKISKDKLLQDGDVVFVDASEDDEGVSKHVVIRNNHGIPFISGLHTIVAKSINNVLHNLYKEYCFQSNEVKKQFAFYAVGIKVSGISKSNIIKIVLKIPPTIEEQEAIATILSDMDSEIETLQAKLNKYKAIKQGMMQELLTGRIRLLEGA